MSGNKILIFTNHITEFEDLKQPVELIKSEISFSSLNDPDTVEEISYLTSEVKRTKIPHIFLSTDSPVIDILDRFQNWKGSTFFIFQS
jgi:hypothetical protein